MALTRNIFSDNKLQAAVDAALEKVPAGRNFALIAHADNDGASLTVIGRIDDHWTIQAAAIKPWTEPLSVQADLVASW